MSALFPEILPEELLYSALARYSDMMRFPGQKAVLDAAFGRRTGIAPVELPGPIDSLLARLPAGHAQTADRLLDGHTTLPYYARFVCPNRIVEAAARLRARGSMGLAESLGIRPSAVPIAVQLRFCPTCAEADRDAHGAAYWRRAHQLAGVLVCPEHRTPLWHSTVSRRPAAGRHVFRSLESAPDGGAPIVFDRQDAPVLVRLAQDTLWLLTGGRAPVQAAKLHARYLERLAERGWMRSAKQIRIGELREAFVAHHGARLLTALGCSLGTLTGEDDWLARLVRKPRAAQHPLHHLLLTEFLGCTISEFFADPVRPEPKDASAQPAFLCPNAVFHVEERGGGWTHPVAGKALRCSACGCTFRPTKTAGAPPVVLLYGFLWEARLRSLVADPTTTLRGMARSLGVTTKTVQRHAARLRVWRADWVARPTVPSRQRLAASEAATHRRRAEWLHLREQHPEEGVQALRNRSPATYAHLYRCDRVWLDEHRPPRRPVAQRAPRVDWGARDREICALAEAVIAAMRTRPGRPIRVTRGGIAARIGHATLVEQHLDRLPHSAACIMAAEENREEFARRKLKWAEAQYLAERHAPAEWELVKRAALRRDLAAALAHDIVAAVHRLGAAETGNSRAA